MDSVLEAGSGCWPLLLGLTRIGRFESSGCCLPTGTANGNSKPLNAPPIDRGQNPTLRRRLELSK